MAKITLCLIPTTQYLNPFWQNFPFSLPLRESPNLLILFGKPCLQGRLLQRNSLVSSGQGAGFPNEKFQVQNHWAIDSEVNSFFHPSKVDQIEPGILGGLVVESKMSAVSGSAALRQLNFINKKGLSLKFFGNYSTCYIHHVKTNRY